MASVAAKFGFRDWRTIYGDAENAELRAARPDPNILLPGDTVVVPDKQPRDEAAETGRRHTFFTTTSSTSLRIQVDYGRPFVYELTVDGAVLQTATSPGDTLIVQAIAADAARGSLTVWPVEQPERTPENGFTFPLDLGFLDPIAAISGVQGRLRNLGFYFDPIDGTLGLPTVMAIESFERSLGAPPTGILTDALRAALVAAHRS
jgi:N-acetylmuramoyl-L-alanine amidase